MATRSGGFPAGIVSPLKTLRGLADISQLRQHPVHLNNSEQGAFAVFIDVRRPFIPLFRWA